MDWHPVHGGCKNTVVLPYFLNKDQLWWNELLGLIRSTLNSSQVADPARACPGVLGLNWYVPEWDGSPLQGCPSAFHWSSLKICCYPYILFGGAFGSPNALTLGYPFWLAFVLEFFVLDLFLLFFYRYKNVLDHKNGELPPECTPNIDRLGKQSTNTLCKISEWKNSVSEVCHVVEI